MHPDALLRFAAAHREFLLMEETIDIGNINRKEFNPMPALFTDDDVRDQIEISKELLSAIKDMFCEVFESSKSCLSLLDVFCYYYLFLLLF